MSWAPVPILVRIPKADAAHVSDFGQIVDEVRIDVYDLSSLAFPCRLDQRRGNWRDRNLAKPGVLSQVGKRTEAGATQHSQEVGQPVLRRVQERSVALHDEIDLNAVADAAGD